MKKIIIFLFALASMYLIINGEEERVLIPDDAIRMRIIANSNEAEDQITKLGVKNELESIILGIENSKSINDTRNNISIAIPLIEEKLTNLNLEHNVEYGINYFPLKEYKGVSYSEGNYESLVVTIGEGAGDNWWCVVFPPLCLTEETHGNNPDVEYSLYIKNIIDRFA